MKNEAKMIEGCIKNQRRMQHMLYKKYAPKMYGVCLRYFNKNEADDVLQDSFVKIFNNLSQYGFKGSFEGWIRKTVIHTCINHLRSLKTNYELTYEIVDENGKIIDDLSQINNKSQVVKKLKRVPLSDIDLMKEYPSTILDQLTHKELLNLISQLPPGYRTIFNLYEIDGYSHIEIAAMLNISVSTSKNQFFKARRWLRNKIMIMKKNIYQET